jgi:hypothetical protein
MTGRVDDALARLEAADPVDPARFEPPALALDQLEEAPRPRRRRRPRALLAPAVAIAAAAAAVLLLPRGGDDVIARAAAALSGDEVVFVEARKVESGRVVTRERLWTSGDGTQRRMLVYTPYGGLESEIVDTPARDTIFRLRDGRADVFEGRGDVATPFQGDPLTLLARAREGSDGLRVIGDGRVRGQRVHLLETRGPFTARIAVSAETFLPVTATIGLSTYIYDRVQKLQDGERLLAPTVTERQATVCFHDAPDGPRCSVRRWP